MSLTLYLVRHAQSADKQSGQTDHARELTATGRRHATELGLFFQEQKYFFDLVICSTAIRAKQTLENILAVAKNSYSKEIIFDEELYHGTSADYYNRVSNFDKQIRTVLWVAHNPSISELLSLLGHRVAESFLPGGFAELQFEWNDWMAVTEHSGKLVTFKNPIH